MKIRSITDVITNSSTEVFAYVDKHTIEKIKELFNLIVSLTSGKGCFDDYFEISLAPNEYAEDYWDEEEKPWEDLSEEEKLDFCLNYEEGPQYVMPTVRIKPKHQDTPKELLTYLEKLGGLGLNVVDAYYG